MSITVNPAAASFVKTDTTAQGSWQGAYGGDGYNVVGNAGSYPGYAQFSAGGQSSYTWAASTSDLRALQKASNPSDHVAAAWYFYSSFTLDINLTDGQAHQVALYLLDWDTTARAEQIVITDASGTVLDTQSASGFHNGAYLVWNISGHVHIQFTRTAGRNAVLSGLFFEAAGA